MRARKKNDPPVAPNEFVYVVVYTDLAGRKRYADGMGQWTDRQSEAYRFRDNVSSIRPWARGWAKVHADRPQGRRRLGCSVLRQAPRHRRWDEHRRTARTVHTRRGGEGSLQGAGARVVRAARSSRNGKRCRMPSRLWSVTALVEPILILPLQSLVL